MLSAITMALWVSATAVGIAGLRLQYPRPKLPSNIPVPITVERVNVNVVRSPPMAQNPTLEPPRQSLPEPAVVQALPALTLAPVADPKLDVPFPVAVKQPSRVVEAKRAVPMKSQPVQASATAVPVQRLVLGEGEGDQPAPEYPREAKLAHQEGSVIVQMTIGENGDVTDAKVTTPSPWPILNQAALRVVRDSWHFPRGAVRYKDIEFVFELHQSKS